MPFFVTLRMKQPCAFLVLAVWSTVIAGLSLGQSTNTPLARFCSLMDLGESRVPELSASLCDCLKEQGYWGQKEFCDRGSGTLNRVNEQIRNSLINRFPEPGDRACREIVTERYLEIFLETMAEQCQTGNLDVFASLQVQSVPYSCWQIDRLDGATGCLEASPCRGSGPSLASYLPLTPGSEPIQTQFTPDQTVRLCNRQLSIAHRLKDPRNVQSGNHDPFFNAITFGHLYARDTYSPMNCHGTANLISGQPLRDLQVNSLQYHSPQIKHNCQATAEAFLNQFPISRRTIQDIRPVAEIVVNMDHRPSCSPQACGQTDLMITGCSQGIPSYFFFVQDQCIKCWKAKFEARDYISLKSPESDWHELKPGCVLTANDHSIVLALVNNGYCYYYESASPYGPPTIFADICARTWSRFPLRLCPKKAMHFDLYDGDQAPP